MSRALDIRAWFNDGKKMKSSFMIIVYDTLNGVDYPIFAASETINHVISEVRRAPMQRLLEVYNLDEDRNTQLAEARTWRLPSDSNTGRTSAGD